MTNQRMRFTFRIPKDLKDKIDKLAKSQGVSSNALMLKILWKHFEAINDV